MTTSQPPTIDCEKVGDQYRFHCPYCRRYHLHGAGDGHRVAHCDSPRSPYTATGYVLRLTDRQGTPASR